MFSTFELFPKYYKNLLLKIKMLYLFIGRDSYEKVI